MAALKAVPTLSARAGARLKRQRKIRARRKRMRLCACPPWRRQGGDRLGRWACHEGHDVDAVAGKERKVRMVLEEFGRVLDRFGRDHDITADGVDGRGYPVSRHA